MSFNRKSLWLAAAVPVSVVTAWELPNVLFKDVVIVGGGASGAYAAVRLRDDYNKSIVLVEKNDHLVSLSLPPTHVDVFLHPFLAPGISY